MTKLYGSLEAGGTKFVCAVGDENFNVVEKTQFPTTTPIETIDKTIEFFSKFDNLAGLAVGSFGPIDIDKNSKTSRRPSGLRKTKTFGNSLAHRTTWLRSDFSTYPCISPQT